MRVGIEIVLGFGMAILQLLWDAVMG